MAITSMDIPRELLDELKTLKGMRTNREAVLYALNEVIQRERQQDAISWMHQNDPLADLREPAVQAQARA